MAQSSDLARASSIRPKTRTQELQFPQAPQRGGVHPAHTWISISATKYGEYIPAPWTLTEVQVVSTFSTSCMECTYVVLIDRNTGQALIHPRECASVASLRGVLLPNCSVQQLFLELKPNISASPMQGDRSSPPSHFQLHRNHRAYRRKTVFDRKHSLYSWLTSFPLDILPRNKPGSTQISATC